MDYNDLYRKVLEIFPKAQMGEDADGQLVIYTDMMTVRNPVEGGESIVVPFVTED